MNLHEYQSKQLFDQYAIPVPKGLVADSPEGGGGRRPEAGGVFVGGQSPGPCGRPG